jgi:hypothetical protein
MLQRSAQDTLSPHSRATLVPLDVKLKAGIRPFNEIQIYEGPWTRGYLSAPNLDLT